MEQASLTLYVVYEDPFWVGILERTIDNQLRVSKTIFGVEPNDNEVLDWFFYQYSNMRFSPAVEAQVKKKRKNPKRIQREIKKSVVNTIGTKSQYALKLQQEEQKIERKRKVHENRKQEKEQQFLLKQQKRKRKHKGR